MNNIQKLEKLYKTEIDNKVISVSDLPEIDKFLKEGLSLNLDNPDASVYPYYAPEPVFKLLDAVFKNNDEILYQLSTILEIASDKTNSYFLSDMVNHQEWGYKYSKKAWQKKEMKYLKVIDEFIRFLLTSKPLFISNS